MRRRPGEQTSKGTTGDDEEGAKGDVDMFGLWIAWWGAVVILTSLSFLLLLYVRVR